MHSTLKKGKGKRLDSLSRICAYRLQRRCRQTGPPISLHGSRRSQHTLTLSCVAIQPKVTIVRRLNGLHLRNPCKYMDNNPFIDPEGWKAELAWLTGPYRTVYPQSGHLSSVNHTNRAQSRESPPAIDRRLDHWATPPTPYCHCYVVWLLAVQILSML